MSHTPVGFFKQRQPSPVKQFCFASAQRFQPVIRKRREQGKKRVERIAARHVKADRRDLLGIRRWHIARLKIHRCAIGIAEARCFDDIVGNPLRLQSDWHKRAFCASRRCA